MYLILGQIKTPVYYSRKQMRTQMDCKVLLRIQKLLECKCYSSMGSFVGLRRWRITREHSILIKSCYDVKDC